MSEMTEHAPGTFCWTDAGTTDVDGAKRFYGEVLGWSFADMPMGEGQAYSMAQVRGKNVAAAYPQMEDQRKQGIPPHWLSYISVKRVDETAAKVEGLGGKLLAPPFDVMEVGRMAMVQDPTGAVVALWEAKKSIGATLKNETGALCWNELLTTDTDKAQAFYTGLLGWTAKSQDMGPMVYTVFSVGEQQVGGMMKISPEMGPMPPNWGVYFAVDDCDAAVERVTRHGGKTLVPAMSVPGVGRMATVQDPQGAVFSVFKFETPPS